MLGDVIRDLGSLLKGLQVSCWDGVWDQWPKLSFPTPRPPPHTTLSTPAVQPGLCNRATVNKGEGSTLWSPSTSCCNPTPDLQQGGTRSAPQDSFCAVAIADDDHVLSCRLTMVTFSFSTISVVLWHAVLLEHRSVLHQYFHFKPFCLLAHWDLQKGCVWLHLWYAKVPVMQNPLTSACCHPLVWLVSTGCPLCAAPLAWPPAAPRIAGHKSASVCILWKCTRTQPRVISDTRARVYWIKNVLVFFLVCTLGRYLRSSLILKPHSLGW